MLHIYTGNGKGKTTAAVGIAVRAAGAGMRVHFFQMMKDGTSSEVSMLKKLGIGYKAGRACCKFSFEMSESEKAAAAAEHLSILSEAAELMRSGASDLIVIDEFFCALSTGLLEREAAEAFVSRAEESTELILTGRGACPPFTGYADYITEMQPLKHPYDNGITARKGIEY